MKVQNERKTGFSSSKILAVMGYNPFRTAKEQWLIDTKQMENEMTESGLQKTKMGNMMEPVIKKAVEDAIGKELLLTKERYMHDDYDFLTIEFDALDTDEKVVYEFKNTEYDEEHLLNMYYPQVQSAIAITGYKLAKICYLKDGWKLGMIDVYRDENFIEHMIKVGAYYIECVRNMIEPDEAYIAELVAPINFFKKYDKAPVENLTLSKEEIDLLHEWADIKHKIGQLEIEEARIKGDFAEKFGKFDNGGVMYTNQSYSKKGAYDIERLKYDFPDIDFEKYRKKDTTYKRQMLKIRNGFISEEIDI
jgi:predicted phage-related endonuclease